MLHLGGPHMSRVVHALVSTTIVLAVSSTIAWAQAPKAGVVTTLEGTVTATHASAPQQPVPLKFKDDVLEIRTPNAVAGVRGSVVVTEVQNLAGQPTTSDIYLLQGQPDSLAAQPADPVTRAPIGTPRPLKVLEQFRVVGLIGTVSPIRPDQLPGIRAGLQPRSRPHVQSAGSAQLSAEAMTTAVALATTVSALGGQPLS